MLRQLALFVVLFFLGRIGEKGMKGEGPELWTLDHILVMTFAYDPCCAQSLFYSDSILCIY